MKPWIALSGDDDGNHYVLTPVSEDRIDFTYEVTMIIDSGKEQPGLLYNSKRPKKMPYMP